MADEFTPNYNFFLPKETDPMSDVKKNITDNFKKIENRNNITVIAAGQPLPQSGNYSIGDRVFRNDAVTATTYPSNYLLVTKDANWGWHWRPIQQTMSPWVTVPSTALEPGWSGVFEIHPTRLFQIALDSRGWCHWRGVIRSKVVGFPSDTGINVLKNLPLGIRPNVNFVRQCALTAFQGAPGIAGYTGLSYYFENTGENYIVGSNTSAVQNIWLDGIRYNNSDHIYYGG